MSGNKKMLVGIVIAALLLGGLYWYMSNKPGKAVETPVVTTPTPAPVNPFALPSGDDTSDAALTQDIAAVDADLSVMASDSAAIDSGMSDKQVAQ